MIRSATIHDAPAISKLLLQLDYPSVLKTLERKLEALLAHGDHHLLVYELDNVVVGFMSCYLAPSLAIDDAILIIGYLAVDPAFWGRGIGKALENAAITIGWENGCDHIRLHCRPCRDGAHAFYQKRGYKEYPVWYQKRLLYAE